MGNPLDKLGTLVGGSQPPGSRRAEDDGPSEADEKRLLEDAGKLIKHAKQLAGRDSDIFDIQLVVELAAELIRDQIREEAYGDEEGEED